MKPKITIHIDGPAGAGKTTLARYIATDLKIRHGVNAALRDGEHQRIPDALQPLENYFDADVTITVEQK